MSTELVILITVAGCGLLLLLGLVFAIYNKVYNVPSLKDVIKGKTQSNNNDDVTP